MAATRPSVRFCLRFGFWFCLRFGICFCFCFCLCLSFCLVLLPPPVRCLLLRLDSPLRWSQCRSGCCVAPTRTGLRIANQTRPIKCLDRSDRRHRCGQAVRIAPAASSDLRRGCAKAAQTDDGCEQTVRASRQTRLDDRYDCVATREQPAASSQQQAAPSAAASADSDNDTAEPTGESLRRLERRLYDQVAQQSRRRKPHDRLALCGRAHIAATAPATRTGPLAVANECRTCVYARTVFVVATRLIDLSQHCTCVRRQTDHIARQQQAANCRLPTADDNILACYCLLAWTCHRWQIMERLSERFHCHSAEIRD